jgi:hypothetical protein
MSEPGPDKSWWHTLPGILTGITAVITAVGGLMIAINQTGWLKPSAEVSPSTGGDSPGLSSTAALPAEPDSTAPASAATTGGSRSISLPAMREYRFEGAVFTVLSADLSQRTAETDTLTIRIRMFNERDFPANLLDDEFRLLIEGVPRAPVSGLNELVSGQSAQDGDVTFVVPRATRDVQLRIAYSGGKTDIPLQLGR